MNQSRSKSNESGSALLMALFVLVLLGGLGIALLFTTQTEARSGQANLRLKRAFYLAEAGEENARQHLFNVNGRGAFGDDLQNHAGVDGVFNFNPDGLVLTYDADGNVTGMSGYGDDDPIVDLTPFGDGWYAAFLTNDPGAGEDPTLPVDNNDRVMFTGIGAGPNRSMEMVQAIVERREIIPQLPPATVTLLGPSPNFWGGSSDVHQYGGDDCGGAGIPGLYVPVVGTIGSDAEADAEAGIHYDPRTDEGPDYDSGPYEREDTFADLTDPTEPTVIASGYDAIDPDDSVWTQCEALHEMVEELRSIATITCCTAPACATPVPANCTLPDPGNIGDLIFIDGDIDIGPIDGAGTLVVTGELRYDGRASWQGMIFAFGAGEVIRHGGGNGSISGAVMVADIAGPDNIYGTADDCTGGDDGFAPVDYDVSGGGNAHTNYCTDDILNSRPLPPYKIVGFRQH